MFDRFLNPILSLQGFRRAQKRVLLDHKSVVFDNLSMCLLSYPQVKPKIDRNE